ncbi:methyltransferase domain-containing protein [Streptomyces sp. BI20]|uniref:methyltransferase domain-containing protein n=1 Tax=Streptomyces sp. BI20 TaxID=3403460 RepID=UPI003C76655E
MAAGERDPTASGRDARALAHAGLVRELVTAGVLPDPAWRAAFEAVPRHAFVPWFFAPRGAGHERLWSEDPDPERRARWLRGVHADTPVAIRLRDGILTSSSSQPSLMARMLHALDVADGHRVLEIGTGSGWNAGLLAHRLGSDAVTTVDLDPEITESARGHLAAVGLGPTVVTGDGARGCPARAPYDRILVTCALPTVPPAWPAQCRPGALVLAPLATGLLALRVRDAGFAEGRFLRTPVYFVPLRGACASPPDAWRERESQACGLTENEAFRFMLLVTGATLHPREALDLWRGEGRPGRERFGVTVTPEGAWAWLDDPDGPYAWPLGEEGAGSGTGSGSRAGAGG